MSTTIKTKQHDTKLKFTDTPTIDGVVVPAVDLASCTLSFIMKSDDPAISIKQDADIELDGTFSYEPVASDVETIGKFRQEWEVVYPGNKILTFPNDGYNTVKIIADLG